jgi:hypothetical protein
MLAARSLPQINANESAFVARVEETVRQRRMCAQIHAEDLRTIDR